MSDIDTSWADTSRVEAWAGELRVNLVRMIALVLFYARHLIEFGLGGTESPYRGVYHARITWIVIGWAVMAIIMHLRLSRRHYHDWTKYVAVAWDCAMVIALCAIAGGPKTPLVLLLFPIAASAALRLSLKLVYFATACAMSAYLILLGMYVWYVVGFHTYYATPELRIPRRDEAIVLLLFPIVASAALRLSLKLVYVATACAMSAYLILLGMYVWYVVGFHTYYATPELRIPRRDEAIVLLSLLVTGLFAGQTVRQMKRLAQRASVVVAAPTTEGA